MIKVILIRLGSNHNNLRTDSVEGLTDKLPVEGDPCFGLVGEGLEFGVRLVQTTEIKSVLRISNSLMEFKTKNSHYKLQIVSQE